MTNFNYPLQSLYVYYKLPHLLIIQLYRLIPFFFYNKIYMIEVMVFNITYILLNKSTFEELASKIDLIYLSYFSIILFSRNL
jgi:hypothetical protein